MPGEINKRFILLQVLPIGGDIGFVRCVYAEIMALAACLGQFIHAGDRLLKKKRKQLTDALDSLLHCTCLPGKIDCL